VLLICRNSFAETRPAQFFIEGIFQRASIDGTVEWSELDVIGSELDLDGAFDFDDSNALSGKIGIILQQKHEFLLDYRRYHFPEETSAQTSFDVNGITVPFNLPISAEISFQTIGLFYGYRFIQSPAGYFSIYPGIEFIDYAVDMKSEIFDIELASLEYANDHILPFVLAMGEYKFHPAFSLAGEFCGGFLDERTAYFARPMLKFHLNQNFSALVGYSQVWYQDESQEDGRFEITLSGPVVGVQVIW
jgi:hypothetical protein